MYVALSFGFSTRFGNFGEDTLNNYKIKNKFNNLVYFLYHRICCVFMGSYKQTFS